MINLLTICACENDYGLSPLANSDPGNFHVQPHLNNKNSLASVYNKYIIEKYRDKTLLFVHDDVYIDDLRLYNKLEEAFDQYDVVGLAGTTGPLNIKPPALWHIMGGPRENFRGSVAHYANDKQCYSTSFGLTPDRVLLIDGLFMAVKVKTLLDKGIKFDESNPARFHFYDLDFCLQCNQAGLKIGVWPIWCIHNSPGLKEYTPEFLKGQEWFINKWKQ
jgi:hypothetical protein